MIFAPRSWPSSPGFAITTLIFRAMPSLSLRSDAHERHTPEGPLLQRALLARPVLEPPRSRRGQRDVRVTGLRERPRRHTQWARDGPEWIAGQLTRLARTVDRPRTSTQRPERHGARLRARQVRVHTAEGQRRGGARARRGRPGRPPQ